jgi:hypothetical protein
MDGRRHDDRLPIHETVSVVGSLELSRCVQSGRADGPNMSVSRGTGPHE